MASIRELPQEVPWRFQLRLDRAEHADYLAGRIARTIVPASAVENGPPSRGIMYDVHRWVVDTVARPDPDLGRPGPQCPFVPPALAADAVYYVAVDGVSTQADVS